MNGTDLLAAYRTNRSEDAFAELVRRYTNFVYSVAKRRLDSAALAEEVVQLVFVRLARATPKLRGDAALAGWLAFWPGDRPPDLKEVLLTELRENSTGFSYKAAEGLGRLGQEAVDVVPDLIEYAKTERGGAVEMALKAACRLQPELRSQYPAIDSKLRNEELPTGPIDFPALLSDPRHAPAMRESLVSGILQSLEPEETKRQLVRTLQHHLEAAPEPQRDGIQRALQAIQKTDTSSMVDMKSQIVLGNLLAEAQVLLRNENNPEKQILRRMLSEFHETMPDEIPTTAAVKVLSDVIRDHDRELHTTWGRQVLKKYPQFDGTQPRSVP